MLYLKSTEDWLLVVLLGLTLRNTMECLLMTMKMIYMRNVADSQKQTYWLETERHGLSSGMVWKLLTSLLELRLTILTGKRTNVLMHRTMMASVPYQ